MTLDLASISPCWQSVAETLQQLRQAGQSLEQFVSRQCDALDEARTSLEEREQELDDARRDVADERESIEQQRRRMEELRENTEQHVREVQQRARRLDQLQQELTTQQAKFAAERERWEAERGDSEQLLFERVGELEAERRAMSHNLDELKAELARLKRSDGDHEPALADLERRHDQLLAEHEQLRHQYDELSEQHQVLAQRLAQAGGGLDASENGPASAHAPAPAVSSSPVEEHDVLEQELQTLRKRTTELAEQVALETRRTSEERNEWLVELRRLRQLVEGQS